MFKKNRKLISLLIGCLSVIGFFYLNINLKKITDLLLFDKSITKISEIRRDIKKKKLNTVEQKPKAKKNISKLTPKMTMKNFSSTSFGLNIDDLVNSESDLLNNIEELILTEDVVDSLPKVTTRAEVIYPDKALDDNINGYVVLKVLVNANGYVEKVQIVNSQPKELFDLAAISSIKKWMFQPARYKGKDVSVWVKQKINFRVN